MSDTCCKVGRVIRTRNLDRESPEGDINEYLTERWLGRKEYSETGLRPLTDWFNKQLLKKEYVANGRSTMETRLESEYDALRSDDEITKGEVIDDLKTDNVDGEDILDTFISKSTLQRHLTDCLEIEKQTENRSRSNWEQERVEYVQETVGENVEGALRSLDNRDELPGATEAITEIPVILRCPECNTRVRFKTAKERGYICEEHLGTASKTGTDSSEADDNQMRL